MKFLKILLWIVLILGAIYLILCATGPKDMNVKRSLTMNASSANIYSLVSDYNTLEKWSPWVELDTNMTNTISGNPGEVGHQNEWKSTELGDGREWITEVSLNQKVRSGLSFANWPDTNYSDIILEPAGDSTKVTWTFEGGEVPFLYRGMMVFMGSMDEIFDKGLTNLKTISEAMPKMEMVAFEVIDIPDTWYVGKMFKGVSTDQITSEMYSTSYTELGTFLGSMKAAPAGAPIGIAHNYDDKAHTMDLEIAMPVAAQIQGTETITSAMIPAGKAARYEFIGNYDQLADAWGKFMYSVMSKHEPRWSSYEIYITNPQTESDPNKQVTHLICPIK